MRRRKNFIDMNMKIQIDIKDTRSYFRLNFLLMGSNKPEQGNCLHETPQNKH